MDFSQEQVSDIIARTVQELKEQNIGKQQFYDESGISSATFSQWNTGARTPSIKSIQKIANYLDVPVDYLLTGKKDKEIEDINTFRQMLVDRPEAKILFQATKNAPTSAILEAAALLMRYKEESERN